MTVRASPLDDDVFVILKEMKDLALDSQLLDPSASPLDDWAITTGRASPLD
jgi:hypothetical protein